MGREIRLRSVDGGTFDAYLGLPKGGSSIGIVVVASGFGLTSGMLETIDGFARQGYCVLGPDMFWRLHPGPLAHDAAGLAIARERSRAIDLERSLDDLARAIATVRDLPQCDGRVAVFGYCFGGRYAFLSVTRLGADAAASFHGNGIVPYLAEAPKATAPMCLHFGDEDRLVPPAEVAAIEAALAPLPHAGVYRYPGAKHGFALLGGESYDEPVTDLALQRSFAMLGRLHSVSRSS